MRSRAACCRLTVRWVRRRQPTPEELGPLGSSAIPLGRLMPSGWGSKSQIPSTKVSAPVVGLRSKRETPLSSQLFVTLHLTRRLWDQRLRARCVMSQSTRNCDIAAISGPYSCSAIRVAVRQELRQRLSGRIPDRGRVGPLLSDHGNSIRFLSRLRHHDSPCRGPWRHRGGRESTARLVSVALQSRLDACRRHPSGDNTGYCPTTSSNTSPAAPDGGLVPTAVASVIATSTV